MPKLHLKANQQFERAILTTCAGVETMHPRRICGECVTTCSARSISQSLMCAGYALLSGDPPRPWLQQRLLCHVTTVAISFRLVAGAIVALGTRFATVNFMSVLQQQELSLGP